MLTATGSVLVVDDSEESRELTRLILVSHGYQVDVAPDASDAATKAADHRPDFILLGLETSATEAERLRVAAPGARLVALSDRIPESPPWSDASIRRERIANLGDFITLL